MKKFALVLSAFALVASGCGNNSVTSKNATDPAVIGTWVSSCQSQSALEAMTSTFVFSEIGEMTIIDQTYPNQGCEGAATKTENTSAIYNVTSSTTSAEGIRKITMKASDFKLPASAQAFTVNSLKMELAITSPNQIELKVLEISATDRATGKAITSPPIDADNAPATTLTRKK